MKRMTSLLAPLALAILGMGCSHDPLVGTWSKSLMVLTFTGSQSYEVNANGTIVVNTSVASSSCTGSWVTTGYTWAATANSITFSGTPTCTGQLTCGTVSVACSNNNQLQAGSCTYALSNNDDTLTLTNCSGTGTTNDTLFRTQ
jgi:hypothetical protein